MRSTSVKPRFKCKKRKYKDEIAAKLALASTWRKDSSTRSHLEKRAYKCHNCTGWHLTSQADKYAPAL